MSKVNISIVIAENNGAISHTFYSKAEALKFIGEYEPKEKVLKGWNKMSLLQDMVSGCSAVTFAHVVDNKITCIIASYYGDSWMVFGGHRLSMDNLVGWKPAPPEHHYTNSNLLYEYK